MIFLIQYDRARCQLVEVRRFSDLERSAAEKARLDLELELNRSRLEHEVVLLEASSEDALRRTHRRYFDTAVKLAEAARASISS